jgi:hypothetical protein
MCYWFYLRGQPAGSRNQLARSEFRRGADISSQATLYNSTPLSGQSICRSNARAAASKFCLARKEPPRQVRRSRKLLEDFQMRLQDDGVELYWPRLTLRKHLPVTACLRRGRLVFYIWGHSSTARWSRLWPMLTRPLLPSPLQESERKRRTRPRVIASPLSYYQAARHIMRDDTAWFRSRGHIVGTDGSRKRSHSTGVWGARRDTEEVEPSLPPGTGRHPSPGRLWVGGRYGARSAQNRHARDLARALTRSRVHDPLPLSALRQNP